ncbi:MAG: GAF domain-containing protein [Gemmatimonadaceae bacterium]
MRANQSTSSVREIPPLHLTLNAIEIADRSAPVTGLTPATVANRETIALRRIAAKTGEEPYAVLQGLLSAAVELCGGGANTSTAGVSLLEAAPDGGQQFRWVALSGCLAAHVGGTTPRSFSPCGECLDKGEPIIISRPDLKFEYFQSAGLEFTEGLILPFGTELGAAPLGTIWVVSHPPRRHHFDKEDVRVMESLASFTAAAYSLAIARDKADGMKREHQEAVAAVTQDMRTPLDTIAGSLYLLTLETQGTLTPGQVEHLARIQTAVRSLQAGVDGLSVSAESGERLAATASRAEFKAPVNELAR